MTTTPQIGIMVSDDDWLATLALVGTAVGALGSLVIVLLVLLLVLVLVLVLELELVLELVLVLVA